MRLEGAGLGAGLALLTGTLAPNERPGVSAETSAASAAVAAAAPTIAHRRTRPIRVSAASRSRRASALLRLPNASGSCGIEVTVEKENHPGLRGT